jgi:type I restriction enzyme S subunit
MSDLRSLNELCDKITDGAHHSPKAFDGGKPMFSVKDMIEQGFDYTKPKTISDEDYNKLIKAGCQPKLSDVLIAKDGSVLKHIFEVTEEPDYVLLSSIAILRPKTDKILPKFIVYSLKEPRKEKDIRSNYVSGSGVPRIVLKDFGKVKINLPPLPEQKAIAHVLGKLDDKIELNRKMNETLEGMAQALFKSWFVDFDPVLDNALAAGNLIPEALQSKAERRKAILARHSAQDEESTNQSPCTPLIYANPELAQQFPDRFTFNETLNKWIPVGWGVEKIKNIGKVITGKTPSSKLPEHFGSKYPFVTPTDFKNYFKLVFDSDRKLSDEGYQSNLNRVLPKNSIIVTCIGSDMGKVALTKSQCVTNQQINALVPESVHPEYMYHYLVSSYNLLRNLAFGGSTMPILNKTDFGNIDVLVPSKSCLDASGMLFIRNDDKILANLKETETLTKLRDTLLPQLISGKVRVPEEVVEKFFIKGVG